MEQEVYKPKLRITTLSENGTPLSDRLVDAYTEMNSGPKVQHNGPIRVEVTLTNKQDIDNFKEFNDSYGHATGDKYLSHLGEVFTKFTQNFRLYFYRYGGEEFVAMAYGYDEKELLLKL